jgi:hypothetical protein
MGSEKCLQYDRPTSNKYEGNGRVFVLVYSRRFLTSTFIEGWKVPKGRRWFFLSIADHHEIDKIGNKIDKIRNKTDKIRNKIAKKKKLKLLSSAKFPNTALNIQKDFDE